MQKQELSNLYPLLSSFDDATIVIPKSIYINEEDQIRNLDSYYEMQGIMKGKSKGK